MTPAVIDRDSVLLAKEFDDRDPAAMDMVAGAIKGAKRNNKNSALDGQAPSDYPEYAEFLVKEGIDSISLNPDSVLKITLRVLEMETKLGRK